MKLALVALAAAFLVSLIGLSPTQAQPRNPHAFCATHRNGAGPGELSEAQVPAAMRGEGALAWRCQDGRTLVCVLGATGGACERTAPVNGARLRSFRQYCRQNANQDIPNALLHGLASTWRCAGLRPVKVEDYPVDRAGYARGSWRPLP